MHKSIRCILGQAEYCLRVRILNSKLCTCVGVLIDIYLQEFPIKFNVCQGGAFW